MITETEAEDRNYEWPASFSVGAVNTTNSFLARNACGAPFRKSDRA
jgi:hypothetical protein